MTAGPGPRVAALLDLLERVADEIVVAVDDRADSSVRRDLATVADRVIVYPYLEPVDRPLPWLFEQCRCEWAFALDDDEVPSQALLESLPQLLADERIGHYSIPRRWLYPDSGTYLDDAPWRPDYQLRLLRTDPRLTRFSSDLHRPIVATGPGRFLATPLWHLDAVLRTFDERRAKAWRYEHARPGLRVGAFALNFAFYLPETRREPRLGAVPSVDQELIEAVLAAGAPAGPARADVITVTRSEIDARWPQAETEPQTGTLELLEEPQTLRSGERRTIDVRVRNTGHTAWPWGGDCAPAVRLGVRWFENGDRELLGAGLWTTLPAPIDPDEDDVVPVHLHAPDRLGRYRAVIDLVEEHVRWFDASIGFPVLVLPRRRVAIAGYAEAVAQVATVLESLPEVEPVVLRRSPQIAPDGHPEASDCRSYLFDDTPHSRLLFGAVVVWRSARLLAGSPRRAHEFVDTIRGCTLFVAVGHDCPPQRRERWALALARWKARALGVPVSTTSDPAALLQLLRDA
ncbi:MAG: hypothetical protein ABI990_04185 [Actinomycetota bacterium]